MNHASPPPSQAALYAALAALQAQLTPATTIAEALALLPAHGLAWYLLPGDRDECHELRLCHAEGHSLASWSEPGASLRVALAGLIGLPALLLGPDDPVADADEQQVVEPQAPPPAEPEPEPEPAPAAIEAAAASLAEATGGTVVEDVEPEAETEDPSHSTEPLSEADRATTLELVKAMTAEQRRAFTIAFRDAFSVPREARVVAPLITQERHRQFVCRFVDEAEGVPAP